MPSPLVVRPSAAVVRRVAGPRSPGIRVIAAGLVLAATAACSTEAATVPATATVTVERTVTVTAPAPAPAADTAPSSSAEAAPSDGIPERADACAVLTRAEAQTVAARRLMEAAPAGVEFGKATYCTYAGYPDDPGVGQIEVFIGDGAKKALEIDKDTLKHEFSQVAGVGEECWAENGQIFFRQGATWASIRVVTLEDDPQKAARLEAAARTVVSRLP